MLKRLVGVITVKAGWGVQSMGYTRHLPLGRPEILAENLDRWQLDEILINVIDRGNRGPDFELMARLSARRLITPLTYLGGVRGPEDAVALVKAGADRIAAERLFRDDPGAAASIATAIGKQAVIRAQAAESAEDGTAHAWDYTTGRQGPRLVDTDIVSRAEEYAEVLLIDRVNEGSTGGYDARLPAALFGQGLQLILFGGVTEKDQVQGYFAEPDVSAVAIGNALSYRELAHRYVLVPGEVDAARAVSYGAQTRGAREW